jgi:hypothetical protein
VANSWMVAQVTLSMFLRDQVLVVLLTDGNDVLDFARALDKLLR